MKRIIFRTGASFVYLLLGVFFLLMAVADWAGLIYRILSGLAAVVFLMLFAWKEAVLQSRLR